MMEAYDDAEKLRLDDDAFDLRDRPSPQGDVEGAVSFTGVTVAITSYPTTAGKFYGVQPQVVTGTETEGSSGTLTNVGTPILAKHVGTTAPPVGTAVVCTFIPYRWQFEY
jgi:hypothetical protein